MFESSIQFVDVITIFCGAACALFFIIGLTTDYCWRKMQEMVDFYRLHRCWRLVKRAIKKRKGGA